MNKEIKKKYYMNYTPRGKLPSEYQEVEYIQGDTNNRTMYINTKVKRNNLPISFDLDIQILSGLSTTTYYWLVYMENWNTSQDGVIFGTYNNAWQVLKSGVAIYDLTSNNTNRTQFIYSHNTESNVSLSGDYTANTTISASGTNYNNDEISLIANGYKIYSCKIYSNEVLVRDFIPCYRKSDYRVGLYDIVNGGFYDNQASETENFLMGRPIVCDKISGYQQVDYLQSTGTQYINSGWTPNYAISDTNIEIEHKSYCTSDGTEDNCTFGARRIAEWKCPNWFNGHYELHTRARSSYASEDRQSFIDTFYNISIKNVDIIYNQKVKSGGSSVSVNGSIVASSTTTITIERFNIDCPMLIFAMNNLPTTSGGENPAWFFKGRLYYLWAKNKGEFVRNFIPMRRLSDGALGLYDLCGSDSGDGTPFYTNSGSGEFLCGADIIKVDGI